MVRRRARGKRGEAERMWARGRALPGVGALAIAGIGTLRSQGEVSCDDWRNFAVSKQLKLKSKLLWEVKPLFGVQWSLFFLCFSFYTRL